MMTSSSARPIKLLILQGDGIGPEITSATLSILRAVDECFGFSFSYEFMPIGFDCLDLGNYSRGWRQLSR